MKFAWLNATNIEFMIVDSERSQKLTWSGGFPPSI